MCTNAFGTQSGSGSFIRGRQKSLSAEYTKERIKERIEENIEKQKKYKKSFPYRKTKKPTLDYSRKSLIDTTGEKFQNSPGLQHWADVQNLKIAASNYSKAESISELKKQIAHKSNIAKEARTSVVEIEHQMKELGEILQYAQQYKDNEVFNYRYHKSKNPDHYLRTHETQLILFDGSLNMLERFHIDYRHMNLGKMKNDFEMLTQKKADLQSTYKSAEKKISKMQKQLDTLSEYLGKDFAHQNELQQEQSNPDLE